MRKAPQDGEIFQRTYDGFAGTVAGFLAALGLEAEPAQVVQAFAAQQTELQDAPCSRANVAARFNDLVAVVGLRRDAVEIPQLTRELIGLAHVAAKAAFIVPTQLEGRRILGHVEIAPVVQPIKQVKGSVVLPTLLLVVDRFLDEAVVQAFQGRVGVCHALLLHLADAQALQSIHDTSGNP